MQKILLKLLVVTAISSTSFAQTKILSFTSSIVLAKNTNGSSSCPSGAFATVGSNKFLAVALNYWTNKTTYETNKQAGTTSVVTNNNDPTPSGIAYIFKFTSSNVVNPAPVLSFTNTNNHTYYLSGSYLSTNSVSVTYFTANAQTNVYGPAQWVTTNIAIDYWGKQTSVVLSTTNGGGTWTTNPTLGTSQTNVIAVTGSTVPNPNRSFWVNIVRSTSGKAVFDVYNP
jgi:hypothetical protein